MVEQVRIYIAQTAQTILSFEQDFQQKSRQIKLLQLYVTCNNCNMCSIIKNNDKILKNNVIQEPEQKRCNCRVPDQCPLNGKCITTCVVIQSRRDN